MLGDAEPGNPARALVKKTSLLYVCSVIPSITGNGLAMRAGMVLEALAERHRVSLLVIPCFGSMNERPLEIFKAMCENVVVIAPGDPQTRIQQAGAAYAAREFDVIHVFRLTTVPFARPYFTKSETRPRRYLDLDDIDSKTHRRIAALYRIAGNSVMAEREDAQSKRMELLEIASFRMFDRVYVCSEQDQRELKERCRAEVRVLKNAVRLPEPISPAEPKGIFRFLFLGTLGYYPNEDAVRYFCTEVLTVIQKQASMPVSLEIVGGGQPEGLAELNDDIVHLIGEVPHVREWYERCHAVIVPIRAAGGTRIKILEAFSYGRPVITTSIGAEGLEVVNGTHVLVADSAEEFAAACLRVMSDPALTRVLVSNAEELLLRSYTSDGLKSAFASL